ncbi:unnamed protein product [Soboliphyme baturini]|uniref:28S ribosomal protein S14, mitochondrial n=1 Tax=Soboliphyme baturini TaxID=241478 RepID=A0A183J7M4_9BILA|nr:unnamed protein product [Soboliphyme baturini]
MLKSLCALRLSSRLLGIRLYVKGSSAPPTTVSSGVPEQLSAEEEEAIYQENFRRALAELKTHDYPKGTKVGRYVMGDYGLYRPRYRKFQEMYIEAVSFFLSEKLSSVFC